jgi:hypothetical protein
MLGIKNEEKQALAREYASLMTMRAWQDLVNYMETERDASMKSIDDKSVGDLNINIVCEQRGIRKGMLKIIQHAEQCAEGV